MLMHYKKVFKSMFEIVIQKKAISKFVTSVDTRLQSTIIWKNILNELTRKNDGSPVTCAMLISIAKALWNVTSEVIFCFSSFLNYSKNNISSFPAFSSLSKELDPFWCLTHFSLLSWLFLANFGEFGKFWANLMVMTAKTWTLIDQGFIIGNNGKSSLVDGKLYPLFKI